MAFYDCYKCLTINLNHCKSILFMFENSDFMPYFDDFFRPGPCGSYVFYHSLPVVNPHTFYEHWLSKLYTKPFLSSSGDMLMKWRQQLWNMTLVTFFDCYKCLTINLNHLKSILFTSEYSDYMPYFDDFFRPGPGGSYICLYIHI